MRKALSSATAFSAAVCVLFFGCGGDKIVFIDAPDASLLVGATGGATEDHDAATSSTGGRAHPHADASVEPDGSTPSLGGTGGAGGSGGATGAGGSSATGGETGNGTGGVTGSGGQTGTGGTSAEARCHLLHPEAVLVDGGLGGPCPGCEALNCDPGAIAGCASFISQEDKDACNAVLACARSTGCIVNSSVDCYCGVDVDLITCKASAANATGLCKATITAGNPVGVSASQIVNSLADVTVPAGNAMNLVQCDVSFCGSPDLGGNDECSLECAAP